VNSRSTQSLAYGSGNVAFARPLLSIDIAKAAASDEVADTLNYKQVAKRIKGFVADSSFQLVETLAERIAGIIREEFDVAWVKSSRCAD